MRDMGIYGKFFFSFLGIFFCSGLFLSGIIVWAVGNIDKDGVPDAGIQISPAKFVWSLGSGDNKVTTINVKNYSNHSQTVVVEAQNFYIGEDGSEPVFFVSDDKHPRKAYDILKWLSLPDDFILQAGESKNVKFEINVPVGQPTNGYYGSIFFKVNGVGSGNMKEAQSKVGINYRIGALVILAVQGDEPMKVDGKFIDFTTGRKVFWQAPVDMYIETMNTGNIHYPMLGKIKIEKNGKKFHTIKLKPQLVYPDILRKYKEEMNFDWWDFGKYTANLAMWSVDKNVEFEKSIEFYVIPWKGLLIIFSGLFVLFLVRKFFVKYVHIGRK